MDANMFPCRRATHYLLLLYAGANSRAWRAYPPDRAILSWEREQGICVIPTCIGRRGRLLARLIGAVRTCGRDRVGGIENFVLILRMRCFVGGQSGVPQSLHELGPIRSCFAAWAAQMAERYLVDRLT